MRWEPLINSLDIVGVDYLMVPCRPTYQNVFLIWNLSIMVVWNAKQPFTINSINQTLLMGWILRMVDNFLNYCKQWRTLIDYVKESNLHRKAMACSKKCMLTLKLRIMPSQAIFIIVHKIIINLVSSSLLMKGLLSCWSFLAAFRKCTYSQGSITMNGALTFITLG